MYCLVSVSSSARQLLLVLLLVLLATLSASSSNNKPVCWLCLCRCAWRRSMNKLACCDAQYADGEDLILYVNKVGPYYNPQETYAYAHLPFCTSKLKSNFAKRPPDSIGSILEGNELVDSGLPIKFRGILVQDFFVVAFLRLTLVIQYASCFNSGYCSHTCLWFTVYKRYRWTVHICNWKSLLVSNVFR